MSPEVKTKVIKRNGKEVSFDISKITHAIEKANEEVDNLHQINIFQISAIADKIAKEVEESTHAVNVEDIQDLVETGIMEVDCAKIMQDFFRQSRERKKEAKRLAKLEVVQDM